MLTTFANYLGITDYMSIIGSNIVRAYRCPWIVSRVSENSELGKLAIVKDPELKLRVIAMLDYYSQFLLRPIHEN